MSVSSQVRFRTGDQALVRQMNLSAIMHYLREHAPVSRSTLAEMTGLNKTTVSSLVGELIERQLVREVGFGPSSSAGRRAMLLTLNPGAGGIVSAEIGVDFVTVICTDFAPHIVWRHQEKIDPRMGQRAILDRALVLMREALDAARSYPTILGLALGVPGLVDRATGTLLFAPNLDWRHTPLRSILADSLGVPVFVDNEANLAALGERYFGAAQGFDDVLYVSAGVGLGGGLVHGGQVYYGATGVAGELGHMTMDPDGEPCSCGNRGCWETQVSQRALFRSIRRAVESGSRSSLSQVGEASSSGSLENLTVPMVVEAARSGDAVALAALDRIGHHLGTGLATLVNALNPELVVFGGILSLAWEYLAPGARLELQRRALPWNRQATQLVLARHGLDACVMGGAAAIYQAILTQAGNLLRAA